MAGPLPERRPSAVLMFIRANWKWILMVIVAAVVVMMVASD